MSATRAVLSPAPSRRDALGPRPPQGQRELGGCRRTHEEEVGRSGARAAVAGALRCQARAGGAEAAAGCPLGGEPGRQLSPRSRGCTQEQLSGTREREGDFRRLCGAGSRRFPGLSRGNNTGSGVVGLGIRARGALGYEDSGYAGLGAPTPVFLS